MTRNRSAFTLIERLVVIAIIALLIRPAAAGGAPLHGRLPISLVMAHFDHSTPAEVEDPAVAARNGRRGLWLFAAYSLGYLAFMLVNAFAPQAMETIVFAGLNLAVVSGLGLIIGAFALALVYAWLCRSPGRAS